MEINNSKIVNVVLCYKNENEVIDYAKHLALLEDSNKISLVVVINAIGEMNSETFKHTLFQVKLKICIYQPKDNLGYMNGLLFGIREYEKESNTIPKFYILSNTDIEIQDNKFFTKLISREYGNNIACIGPSVCVKSLQSYDNPVADNRRSLEEINSLIRKFSIPVFSEIYVYLAFIKPKFIKRKRDNQSREVYEVHGCYFILDGKFADEIKNEKFGALMYSEETFIAEHVYTRGKKEYYDAELEVQHLEHTVTSTLKAKKRAEHLKDSMKWIRQNYYR